MARLAGKVAVVTGAGSGIGRAVSLLFAEEGATVLAVDRDVDATEETVALLRAAAGDDARAVAVRADVGVPADLAAVARACADGPGRVDVLVNNAAIRKYGTVPASDVTDWDEIFAVNLRGPAVLTGLLVPLMAAGGGGSVVNVSSVHAVAGRPGMALYDTMKAGMLGMTRSLANDHAGEGLRVNAVLPGRTLTEYHQRLAREAGSPVDPSVTTKAYAGGPGLLRRQATPREIAYAVLFLASDEASYVTGVCLPVDGGVAVHKPS